MAKVVIALANVSYPANAAESVLLAEQAIREAVLKNAAIICFPECFIPGYRMPGETRRPVDARFLEDAWSRIAAVAGEVGVGVVLGTDRITDRGLMISALVINADGSRAGFQDKVQLDPSEESIYVAGEGRRIFKIGELTFGISICHEGFRYPETVRWAARNGAQLVFHPHFDPANAEGYQPTCFADSKNSFHEKAMLCRAAENTCFIASVNCAGKGAGTTSAIVRPDGTLLCHQPYGKVGLLVAEIDTAEATGLLAARLKDPNGARSDPRSEEERGLPSQAGRAIA